MASYPLTSLPGWISLIVRDGRLRSWQIVAAHLVAFVSSFGMLVVCQVVIGAVAAFDTYLTIKYAVSLDIYELNPVGRWLMQLDVGPVSNTEQIAEFITAKFMGTLTVLIIIQALAYWRLRLACMVAHPVAGFQLFLLQHLLCGVG